MHLQCYFACGHVGAVRSITNLVLLSLTIANLAAAALSWCPAFKVHTLSWAAALEFEGALVATTCSPAYLHGLHICMVCILVECYEEKLHCGSYIMTASYSKYSFIKPLYPWPAQVLSCCFQHPSLLDIT